MIPFLSKWLSKSKQRWLTAQEAALTSEFAPKLRQLQETQQHQLSAFQQQSEQFQAKVQAFQREQARLADQEQLLADRKLAVEKANVALREQLRLLEAKAAPDRVWVEAFSRGYAMAWQTVWPIMAEGVQNLKTLIEQKAIEETLTRLDTVVVERATQLGTLQAQDLQSLQAKRAEFERKRDATTQVAEKERYTHYVTALDWMLHANDVHPHQPSTQ